MTSPQVFREQIDGFECVGLRNTTVELLIVPQLGSKIIRLRSRLSGRQWMWASGRAPQLFHVTPTTPFDAGPLIGADECIPTISPCHWDQRELPDHGEAWTQAWQLDAKALEIAQLTTRLNLPISPFTLERTITLDAATVTLAYRLANRSNHEQCYLWAFHPMMVIEADDQIELPPEVRQVRNELTMGGLDLGRHGNVWPWPTPLPGIDFSKLDLGGANRAVKLFTQTLQSGWARIANKRTGDQLTIRFDPNELNTLGIWINRGGFGAYHHIALEPTCGAPDALDIAVKAWRRHGTLLPESSTHWTVALELQ
jgi:galactose mutarotase-like enzyme